MSECTLHEAMRIVLSERPSLAATTSELSDEIERRRLYLRNDGSVPKARQINGPSEEISPPVHN
jgi:hypothetical protein